jgi:hypothetical protein
MLMPIFERTREIGTIRAPHPIATRFMLTDAIRKVRTSVMKALD